MGGVAVLFWSTTVFPNGGVPTPYGQLHVNLADPLFQIGPILMPPRGTAPGSGAWRLTVDLGPANSPLRPIMQSFNCLHAQAAVRSTTGEIALSSLYTMRTALAPPGWTVATATAGTGNEHKTPDRSPVPGVMEIRNDGRGKIVVQPLNPTGGKLGPASEVCERSCVRVLLPAGTKNVEVSSPNNANTKAGFETKFVYQITP